MIVFLELSIIYMKIEIFFNANFKLWLKKLKLKEQDPRTTEMTP